MIPWLQRWFWFVIKYVNALTSSHSFNKQYLRHTTVGGPGDTGVKEMDLVFALIVPDDW